MAFSAPRRVLPISVVAACWLLLSAAPAFAANFPFAPAQAFDPGFQCLVPGDYDEDGVPEAGYDAGHGDSCGQLGDFNGDGHLDLLQTVATGTDTKAFRLKLGAGDGTFSWAPGSFGNGSGLAEVGDLNGDGIDDVAAATRLEYLADPEYSFEVTLFEGGTEGLPQQAGAVRAGRAGEPGSGTGPDRPADLVIADINEDGDGDLVTATNHSYGSGVVELIASDGTGGFEDPAEMLVGNRDAVVSGDVDRDGHADIVVSGIGTQSSPGIWVLFGDGDGAFTTVNAAPGLAGTPLLGDFNGDGSTDIAARVREMPIFPFGAFLNEGNRTFVQTTTTEDRCFTPMPEPRFAGDFDGDGVDDVLVDSQSGPLLYRGDRDAGPFRCWDATPGKGKVDLVRIRAKVPQRLFRWRAHSAWFRVRCSADCVVTGRLVISERLRRDAGLKSRIVGRASYAIAAGKPRSRRVRVHRAALRAILRVRPHRAGRLIHLRVFARAV